MSRFTNRIKEAEFVFDTNGNLIEDPNACYDYDLLNRMTASHAKAGGVCSTTALANYFYDADNLRVLGGKNLHPALFFLSAQLTLGFTLSLSFAGSTR